MFSFKLDKRSTPTLSPKVTSTFKPSSFALATTIKPADNTFIFNTKLISGTTTSLTIPLYVNIKDYKSTNRTQTTATSNSTPLGFISSNITGLDSENVLGVDQRTEGEELNALSLDFDKCFTIKVNTKVCKSSRYDDNNTGLPNLPSITPTPDFTYALGINENTLPDDADVVDYKGRLKIIINTPASTSLYSVVITRNASLTSNPFQTGNSLDLLKKAYFSTPGAAAVNGFKFDANTDKSRNAITSISDFGSLLELWYTNPGVANPYSTGTHLDLSYMFNNMFNIVTIPKLITLYKTSSTVTGNNTLGTVATKLIAFSKAELTESYSLNLKGMFRNCYLLPTTKVTDLLTFLSSLQSNPIPDNGFYFTAYMFDNCYNIQFSKISTFIINNAEGINNYYITAGTNQYSQANGGTPFTIGLNEPGVNKYTGYKVNLAADLSLLQLHLT